MPDNDFPQRIRDLRAKHGLTLEQVAQAVGVGRSTVRKWETGMIENMRRDKIAKLAAALHTTPAYLMGWEEDAPSSPGIPNHPQFLPMPAMKKWRVIGSTACGEPMHRDLEEFVFAPDSINADLVFRCEGDSMIGAHILDGDIAFVRTCEVKDGQIAVVRIEDDYSLKRIYRGPDYLELRSENPKYPPIVIRGEQENAEIVGKAVHFLSRVI